MEKSVIIIGSGLGGLECGYILAKKGFRVTILERASKPGGCLQSFRRGGRIFDTGLHYVGGLGEGQSLRPFFEYFGLMDLPWKQINPDCVDEIVIGAQSYPLASGHDRFVGRLAERFPAERNNLNEYARFLKKVGDDIFKIFEGDSVEMNDLLGLSAYEYLRSTIKDPLLRQVLSGAFMRMELRESLPLYVFAQINESFIQSAWKLEGGGDQIVRKLVDSITSMGGTVRTNAKVTSIRAVCGEVSEVEVNGSETVRADWVISDAHPAVTLGLISDGLRKVYKERISALDNTFGVFTANICLKPKVPASPDGNIFIHREGIDLWHSDPSVTESVMVHFYPEPRGGVTHLDLMSPMSFIQSEDESDHGLSLSGKIASDSEGAYKSAKQKKFEECLDLVGNRLPWLEGSIESFYTSTPLTYSRYTSTPQGAAFGIRHDWRTPLRTILSPRTPLKNLLFTGQSLNLHGLLGVSMTSVLTCREILGNDIIVLR